MQGILLRRNTEFCRTEELNKEECSMCTRNNIADQMTKQEIIKLIIKEKANVAKVITEKNIIELINAHISFCSKSYEMVYRGLTYDSELFPNVIRNIDKRLRTYGDLREYEEKLYDEYNRYSIQYLPYYESLVDWLASAQHFGLKTRLVDWTYNPMVALFFALHVNKHDSYILGTQKEYCINEFFYFDSTTDPNDEFTFKRMWQIKKNLNWIDDIDYFKGGKNNPKNKEKADEFRKIVYNQNRLCFLETNNANSRIIAQDGLLQLCCFRTNEDNTTTIESIKNQLVEDIKKNVKEIYIVQKESKLALRKLLNKMKIATPKLFPDIINICKYINNVHLDL